MMGFPIIGGPGYAVILGNIDSLLLLIEQEEARRDRLVAEVRDAVSRVYVTGGDTDFLVRRSEVHRLVAGALERRTMDGNLVALINAIVAGMGAVPASIGNRPVFLAMRRRGVEGKVARQESRTLRRLWRAKKETYRQRAKKLSAEEVSHWQRRLSSEGLDEVALIPRRDPFRRRRRNHDETDGEIADGRDGVHRQRQTSQAEIYSAANERVSGALDAAEMDVAVLRLRAQGLALRPIAIKLGIDKMTVDDILKRALARQTSSQGCE